MIERIKAPQRSEFFQQYVKPQKPVILTDLMENWPALKLWSVDYFKQKFGHLNVPIQDYDINVSKDPADYLQNQKVINMPFAQYLDTLDDPKDSRYYLVQADFSVFNNQLHQDLGKIEYLSWLNKARGRKYFIRMGQPRCNSFLHVDNLHNFFCQIEGRKRWGIYPQEQIDNLYIPSQLRIDRYSPINLANIDHDKYPRFKLAQKTEIILEKGEVLYLPPNWGHYVDTVDFSIGVNIWWDTPINELKSMPDYIKRRLLKQR